MDKRLIALMVLMIAVVSVSGCTESADFINRGICEANGGTWMEDYSECCPKGCPDNPINSPDTTEEEILVERCGICWLN